jgi:hypothetical protein
MLLQSAIHLFRAVCSLPRPGTRILRGPRAQSTMFDRTMDTCAHLTPRVRTLHHVCLTPRVPYTTCTLHHVYLTPRVHVFPPLVHGSVSRDYTRPHRATSLYTRLWSSHTNMATLHDTTFSPHIRSIITSAFGSTTQQINMSL